LVYFTALCCIIDSHHMYQSTQLDEVLPSSILNRTIFWSCFIYLLANSRIIGFFFLLGIREFETEKTKKKLVNTNANYLCNILLYDLTVWFKPSDFKSMVDIYYSVKCIAILIRNIYGTWILINLELHVIVVSWEHYFRIFLI
jgi:hypothetical protein